jgi:hypothetical protein
MGYRHQLPIDEPRIGQVYAAMTTLERGIFALAIVNFATFIAAAMALGGDAINGTSRDGLYYLAQHGVYTEVSHSVFRYSLVHTLSMFVTHPLAIAVGLRARRRAQRLAEQGDSDGGLI